MAHSIVALRERVVMETDLRRMVDMLPGVVWTEEFYRQGHLFNHRWREPAGISADGVCDDRWQVKVHPDDRLEVTGIAHSLLGLGRCQSKGANPLCTGSGTSQALPSSVRSYRIALEGPDA